MKLQSVLVVTCVATIAGILFVHHRTRTVVPVNDVIVYAGGPSERADDDQDRRLGASIFNGTRLSRRELEDGANRYHQLLAEARAADDQAPAALPQRTRPQWMPSGHARTHEKSDRPSSWKIGMNHSGSGRVRPFRGSSRAGIYSRAERTSIQNRPSVFERSRHFHERGSVYPLGSHDQSARQRRIYNHR